MIQSDDDPESAGESERARAQSLSRLVDAMTAGESPPPALEAEDRALLETATEIHAAGHATLDASRRDRVIDSALAVPVDEPVGNLAVLPLLVKQGGKKADTTAELSLKLRPVHARLKKHAPWAVALLALGLLLFFLLGTPPRAPATEIAPQPERPLIERSRPADELVGRVARADAAGARARIDAIFADRLAGFRSVLLGEHGASAVGTTSDDGRLTLPLLLGLAQAKNYHHQADVHLADGNPSAAIDTVAKVLLLRFPKGMPEGEDVLLDARARLGKLYLGMQRFEEAVRVVDEGIAGASRESFFLANLQAVAGEIHERRAMSLDGKDPSYARAERKKALDAYDRSIRMNDKLLVEVLQRSLP
ncbi:MAG: hypothetical protein HY698_18830 [Deltaproteobacteria bacterium]|nr:hypothetical protein [Deltaproteobacteria bacterium]